MRTGESRRGTAKYTQRHRGGARATGWVAARRSRTIDAGSETRQTALFGRLHALSRAIIETVSEERLREILERNETRRQRERRRRLSAPPSSPLLAENHCD